MSSIHKNYISCGILVIGLLFFCCYVNALEFIPASITMLASLLLWIAFNIHFDMFNKISFAKVLCYSGLLLSITIFFLFGIEEVPFPIGALLFHIDGIAASLFVILLSMLPILFFTQGHPSYSTANSQSSYIEEPKSDSPTDESLDDSWEIATDDDLESGNYEVAA